MVLTIYKKKSISIYEERTISPIDILNQLPAGLGFLVIVIIVYSLFNFMNCLGLVEGSAGISDGKFIITKRGGFLYYISHEYYIQHRLYELRLWSGTLLIFYLICSIYYWFFSPVDKAEKA